MAIIKKIGVLYHPKVETARTKARELVKFLEGKGVSVWHSSSWETEEAKEKTVGTDLLLTVGGDGTILRAAQAALGSKAAITGVNLGKLGFMTEFGPDEAAEKLTHLLAGEGWIDERTMLQVELDGGKAVRVFHALNDAVMARAAIVRVIHIETSISGEPLNTYKADAVVVATATGSTGYALAAGGPILYPQSSDFVLVPVAQHAGMRYPIVVPTTAKIVLKIETMHAATLNIDGHTNMSLANGDTVTLRRSPYSTRFLRLRPAEAYYGLLKERLIGK